ncbi:MAG: hypothetical protein A2104_07485 [Candidatus Melainabacteria bacterium GWF2_32_7]|nr:MAG: hypothetical protein A2104_07485 [Candidatus Melainabacteria bacterium GWF2_32_7]
MTAVLTKEDIVNWRRSTERITLEDYAKRLGKVVSAEKKETNDLHDIVSKKVVEETVKEVVKKVEEVVETPQKSEKPDIEIKISFKEKLNKREEVVFNYFFKNKKRKVFANEIAKILNLPNDYVYKYIRNLRKKIAGNILVNAENGGYILNI